MSSEDSFCSVASLQMDESDEDVAGQSNQRVQLVANERTCVSTDNVIKSRVVHHKQVCPPKQSNSARLSVLQQQLKTTPNKYLPNKHAVSTSPNTKGEGLEVKLNERNVQVRVYERIQSPQKKSPSEINLIKLGGNSNFHNYNKQDSNSSDTESSSDDDDYDSEPIRIDREDVKKTILGSPHAKKNVASIKIVTNQKMDEILRSPVSNNVIVEQIDSETMEKMDRDYIMETILGKQPLKNIINKNVDLFKKNNTTETDSQSSLDSSDTSSNQPDSQMTAIDTITNQIITNITSKKKLLLEVATPQTTIIKKIPDNIEDVKQIDSAESSSSSSTQVSSLTTTDSDDSSEPVAYQSKIMKSKTILRNGCITSAFNRETPIKQYMAKAKIIKKSDMPKQYKPEEHIFKKTVVEKTEAEDETPKTQSEDLQPAKVTKKMLAVEQSASISKSRQDLHRRSLDEQVTAHLEKYMNRTPTYLNKKKLSNLDDIHKSPKKINQTTLGRRKTEDLEELSRNFNPLNKQKIADINKTIKILNPTFVVQTIEDPKDLIPTSLNRKKTEDLGDSTNNPTSFVVKKIENINDFITNPSMDFNLTPIARKKSVDLESSIKKSTTNVNKKSQKNADLDDSIEKSNQNLNPTSLANKKTVVLDSSINKSIKNSTTTCLSDLKSTDLDDCNDHDDFNNEEVDSNDDEDDSYNDENDSHEDNLKMKKSTKILHPISVATKKSTKFTNSSTNNTIGTLDDSSNKPSNNLNPTALPTADLEDSTTETSKKSHPTLVANKKTADSDDSINKPRKNLIQITMDNQKTEEDNNRIPTQKCEEATSKPTNSYPSSLSIKETEDLDNTMSVTREVEFQPLPDSNPTSDMEKSASINNLDPTLLDTKLNTYLKDSISKPSKILNSTTMAIKEATHFGEAIKKSFKNLNPTSLSRKNRANLDSTNKPTGVSTVDLDDSITKNLDTTLIATVKIEDFDDSTSNTSKKSSLTSLDTKAIEDLDNPISNTSKNLKPTTSNKQSVDLDDFKTETKNSTPSALNIEDVVDSNTAKIQISPIKIKFEDSEVFVYKATKKSAPTSIVTKKIEDLDDSISNSGKNLRSTSLKTADLEDSKNWNPTSSATEDLDDSISTKNLRSTYSNEKKTLDPLNTSTNNVISTTLASKVIEDFRESTSKPTKKLRSTLNKKKNADLDDSVNKNSHPTSTTNEIADVTISNPTDKLDPTLLDNKKTTNFVDAPTKSTRKLKQNYSIIKKSADLDSKPTKNDQQTENLEDSNKSTKNLMKNKSSTNKSTNKTSLVTPKTVESITNTTQILDIKKTAVMSDLNESENSKLLKTANQTISETEATPDSDDDINNSVNLNATFSDARNKSELDDTETTGDVIDNLSDTLNCGDEILEDKINCDKNNDILEESVNISQLTEHSISEESSSALYKSTDSIFTKSFDSDLERSSATKSSSGDMDDTSPVKSPARKKSRLTRAVSRNSTPAVVPLKVRTRSSDRRKSSRELTSLLALSKEARLDTNIAHKRKIADPTKGNESDGRDTPNSKKMKMVQSVETTPVLVDKLLEQPSTPQFTTVITSDKDAFCWQCHKDGIKEVCSSCPRAYHTRCIKAASIDESWLCTECRSIRKAESIKTRPPSMKDIDAERLCGLLKYALQRMMQILDAGPFIHDVSETEFPDYKKYIIQPMTLTKLEKNVNDNLYSSTAAFEADAKWILHNSIIFNSHFSLEQAKLTSTAKILMKVCKQEISEIENCPNCYENANTQEDWFVKVCPKPHLLLWAKLKGFPYWPAKAMSTNSSGLVDVRFFGAHDRAWVSYKDCYLYGDRNPNPTQVKRNDINKCLTEVQQYISNLSKVYGNYIDAPYKTPYLPKTHTLQVYFANFDPNEKKQNSSPSKVLKVKVISPKVLKVEENTPKVEKVAESILKVQTVVESTPKVQKVADTIPKVQKSAKSTPKIQKMTENTPKVEKVTESTPKIHTTPEKSPTKLLSAVTTPATDSTPIQKSPEIKVGAQPIKRERSLSAKNKELIKIITTAYKSVTKQGSPEESHKAPVEPPPTTKVSIIAKIDTLIANNDAAISNKNIPVFRTNSKMKSAVSVSKYDSALKNDAGGDTPVAKVDEPVAKSETPVVATPTADVTPTEDATPTATPKPQETKSKRSIKRTKRLLVTSEEEPILSKLARNKTPKTPTQKSKNKFGKIKISNKLFKKSTDDDSTEDNNTTTEETIRIIVKEEDDDMNKPDYMENDLLEVLYSEHVDGTKLSAADKTPKPKKMKNDDNESFESKLNKQISEIEAKIQKESKEAEKQHKKKQKEKGVSLLKNQAFNMEINEAPKLDPPKTSNKRKLSPQADTTAIKKVTRSSENENIDLSKTLVVEIKSEPESEDEVSQAIPELILLPEENMFVADPLPEKPVATSAATPSTVTTTTAPNKKTEATTKKSLKKYEKKGKLEAFRESTKKAFPTYFQIKQHQAIQRENAKISATTAVATTTSPVATNNSEPVKTVPPTTGPPNLVLLPQVVLPNQLGTNTYFIPLTNLVQTSTVAPTKSTNVVNVVPTEKQVGPVPHTDYLTSCKLPIEEMTNLICPVQTQPPQGNTVTDLVNTTCNKLSEQFRTMMVDMLTDMGKTTDNAEATITNLRLEMETLKKKHKEEIVEIKKNVGKILQDVEKSLLGEKEKILKETTKHLAAEMATKVNEVKSKQWCACCFKEAQFYCCWNTSYCNYPCQAKHWPRHMSECTQNGQTSKTVQPLILRPALPPPKGIDKVKQIKIVSKPVPRMLKPSEPSSIALIGSPSVDLLSGSPLSGSPGTSSGFRSVLIQNNNSPTNPKLTNQKSSKPNEEY